ncbi:MAG: MFS transporter [Sphingomonadales bacterium]|nr:MFS transporter [Sphingomonadales bacterium]
MQKAAASGVQFTQADATRLADQRRSFIRRLTLLISGGMFIDGFVLGGIGTVMPSITHDLGLTLAWQGLIGASALIGIFVGGPFGGYLADRIGRKPMFTIDLMIFLVGSVLQFFVVEAWQLFAVRVLMGLAIGADYAIGWPLLAEFAPARIRGKLLSVQEVGWYAGYMIAYAAGYAMVKSSMADWHIILGLSTIPTVIVILMRLGTPESPRWLISQGRREEAMAIAAQYMEEHEQHDILIPSSESRTGFAPLFSSKYIRMTLFSSIFWVCCVTPYFAIGTFAPTVFEHLGIKDGLTGGLALNVVAWLATIFTVFTVERLGSRSMGMWSLYISAAALCAIGLLPGAAPAVAVGCVLVFAFAIAIGNTLTSIFGPEVFPTELRGTGVGVGAAVSRIGAATGTFVLPAALVSLGTTGTMLIGGAICLFGAIVTQWLAPENTGKILSAASDRTQA